MNGLARAALAEFALPAGTRDLVALGNAGGFSGASLWRVAERWCLRAWPPNTGATQVATAHTLMRRAADARLLFVPRLVPTHSGATLLDSADRLWELTTWMPGLADYNDHPSPARLRSACQALARLHTAWQSEEFPAQVCPALRRRLHAAAEGLDYLRRPPPSRESPWREVPQATRAWGCLVAHLEAVPAVLAPWANVAVPVQWCVCDLWHDHLLFRGDHLTGLVDYGAAKVDHVGVDLARLLGSLVGDDAEAWRVGLAAYAEVCPAPVEVELARALDRTGVAVGVWTWLRRLFVEQRFYPDWAVIDRRLAALLDRLEGGPARDILASRGLTPPALS